MLLSSLRLVDGFIASFVGKTLNLLYPMLSHMKLLPSMIHQTLEIRIVKYWKNLLYVREGRHLLAWAALRERSASGREYEVREGKSIGDAWSV